MIKNEEAKQVVKNELLAYRSKSYDDLRKLLRNIDSYTVVSSTGHEYQIEIQVIWDDKPDGNIRVIGGISGPTFWSCVSPLTDCFIMSPDGHFVDEAQDTLTSSG